MKTFFPFMLMLCCVFSAMSQTPNDSISTAEQDSIKWERLLDGVNITAQRQLIKQDIDRIGYDVQADEDSKTENVIEMLRKVPLVTIDGEDNILVKGNSNYKIYKNGHLDQNLSKNAKDILKAMPASAVKRIEVITDPGAREDAEGVNAILNIVMMDNKTIDGITGTVNAAYSSLNHPNLSTYLTAQFGKLITSFNYGYAGMSKKETKNKNFVYRQFVESGNINESKSEGTNAGNIHFANLDASYEIDSLNLLSASFGGYFYKLDVEGGGSTLQTDALGNTLYSFHDEYWLPGYGHHSWNGQFDYEHKTHRKGEALTLSYMLSLIRQHNDQETNITETMNVPFNYQGYLERSRERFTEHTFQLDYLRPLWDGHKLEIGAKYIYRKNSSNNKMIYFQEPDNTISATDFIHSTQVAAAYADYLYNKNKWSARAGLRYEYSYLSGKYPNGMEKAFHQHLNDWVPQASLKYKINDRQSLKLGYNTSISRPGINYLNPAVVSTPSNVYYGNAYLKSAHQQSLQLSYMYVGERLTLQLMPQFHFYNQGIGSIVSAKDDIRYSTYGNILKQHRWQLEGYIQWKPFANTTFVTNINFTDNHVENTSAQLNQHLTSAFYYINVSQKLPWKINATAYIFGQIGHSPMNIYGYSRPWQRYGFSLQRSFLRDDRLTIRLTARAPFHKDMHYKTKTNQGDIIGWGDNINAQNSRQFQISVSYRFGKLKAGVKKTETTIQNSDIVGGISKNND